MREMLQQQVNLSPSLSLRPTISSLPRPFTYAAAAVAVVGIDGGRIEISKSETSRLTRARDPGNREWGRDRGCGRRGYEKGLRIYIYIYGIRM